MDRDLQQAAQKAIQAGINPQLVNQRLQQIQQTRQNNSSVLSGNLSSPNLVKNNGVIGNIVNAVARPFVQTGQTIAGSGYEALRAYQAQHGLNDAYAMKDGQAVHQNPFLSQQQVEHPGQVLGNQIKNSAAIASYAIPIGGETSFLGKTIAPGAFKGGAIAGGLQSLSGDNVTPESVLKGAVIGGTVGKAFDLAGSVFGKFNKAGQTVEDAGTNLRTGNVSLKASVNGAADEKAAVDVLKKYGIKGTPQARYEKIQPVMDDISNQIQQSLASNTKTVDPTLLEKTFMQKVTPYVRQGDITLQEAKQGFQEYMNAVEQVSPGAFGDTANIFSLKKDLQQGMSTIYNKTGSLTPAQKATKAIRDTLDEVIATANPEVKQLTRDQSKLYDAVKSISAARKTVPTVRALGITIPKGPYNAGVDMAGQALEKTGGAVKAATLWPGVKMPVSVRQVLPRLANVLTSIEGQGSPVSPSSPMSTQNLGSSTQTAPSNPNQLTPDVVAAAYYVLPKAKADVIKQIYDIQQKANGSAKPLSVAAQKQKELGASGLQAHADALKMFQSDPNIVLKRAATGGLASRQFDAAINRAVEALLRARSGAAVPQTEVNRYAAIYTPTLGDSYQTGLYKLQNLQNDLQSIYSGSENTVPDVSIQQP